MLVSEWAFVITGREREFSAQTDVLLSNDELIISKWLKEEKRVKNKHEWRAGPSGHGSQFHHYHKSNRFNVTEAKEAERATRRKTALICLFFLHFLGRTFCVCDHSVIHPSNENLKEMIICHFISFNIRRNVTGPWWRSCWASSQSPFTLTTGSLLSDGGDGGDEGRILVLNSTYNDVKFTFDLF